MVFMTDKTLADGLITLIKSEANNNPAPQHCTITKTYENNYVDIKLTDTGEVLKYIQLIGDNTLGIEGVLCFLNGDDNNGLVITDNTTVNNTNTILALGLGLFTIKSDGCLWVELPMGISNPFTISDGDLIVTIPEGANNDYEIVDNDLIYHRGDE